MLHRLCPFLPVVAILAASCARELRSSRPELWLELQSEHFTLRTDLPEEDARGALADLELIRASLLSAGWHGGVSSPARITVVAVASDAELHEFLPDLVGGVAGVGRFDERTMLVNGDGNLLASEVVKHEVAHALLREFLVTNPRWVSEGIACFLETLDIDRKRGVAVRGASTWERRDWLNRVSIKPVNWSLDIMGMGSQMTASNGFAFETLSWGLVHWLADTSPKQFEAFLSGLSRGEGMWKAFGAAFPALTEERINDGMRSYLRFPYDLAKERFPVTPWTGTVAVRGLPAGEVHALRAELFKDFSYERNHQAKLDEELARGRAIDPAHPLLLALSGNKHDFRLAIERHPEDWRSWVLWHDENGDADAIRKAAELAPDNAGVLARFAVAEQLAGRPESALRLGERAVALLPGPFQLHALATVYEKNGRCADARLAEERAIDALPDRVDQRIPGLLRARLAEIASACGQAETIGSATRRAVEVQPVLKICRQPIELQFVREGSISAQFTIREDGGVTAVAIQGARNSREAGVLRQFVESCSFEPVVIDGKPRPVQVNLTLDELVR